MAEADPSPPVAEATPAPTSPPSERVNWLAELRGLALMLLAVVGFHSLIAKPFYIPSISMMPSLLVGYGFVDFVGFDLARYRRD